MDLGAFFRRSDVRLLILIADAAKDHGDQETAISAIELVQQMWEQLEREQLPVPEMSLKGIYLALNEKCKIANYLTGLIDVSPADFLSSAKLIHIFYDVSKRDVADKDQIGVA